MNGPKYKESVWNVLSLWNDQVIFCCFCDMMWKIFHPRQRHLMRMGSFMWFQPNILLRIRHEKVFFNAINVRTDDCAAHKTPTTMCALFVTFPSMHIEQDKTITTQNKILHKQQLIIGLLYFSLCLFSQCPELVLHAFEIVTFARKCGPGRGWN